MRGPCIALRACRCPERTGGGRSLDQARQVAGFLVDLVLQGLQVAQAFLEPRQALD
jgi:hypothetical protein